MWSEKTFLEITVWQQEVSLMMPDSYPEEVIPRKEYITLHRKPMKDSDNHVQLIFFFSDLVI